MSRVAFVTGGAIRIGRAIALGLADSGFDVAVNYHSSAAPAELIADEIRQRGRRCLLLRGDVSSKSDVSAMSERIEADFGRLDVLVNSASTFNQRPLLEIDEAEWDHVMGVNLKGPFLTVQALAPLLVDSEGSVINIVDLSAFQPWTVRPHHSVSKAALLHLTRIMARTLAPSVRVNAIAPGTVLPPDDMSEQDLERERRHSVLGTIGSAEDVVRTVLFLESSPFITGEVIVVDGGRGLSSAEG